MRSTLSGRWRRGTGIHARITVNHDGEPAPVAGAVVKVAGRRAVTNAPGDVSFLIISPSRAGRYRVTVVAAGYRAIRSVLTVSR